MKTPAAMQRLSGLGGLKMAPALSPGQNGVSTQPSPLKGADMENDLASISLGTQALLSKIIAELKLSGVLSDQQISRAFRSARKVLEEDGDTMGLRAGLFLETLHDELVPGNNG